LNHSNALATQAPERYLLGELTAGEAEQFELHYFECPQCALALESGDQFISAVREGFPAAVPQRAPASPPKPSFAESLAAFFRQPALGFALAALIAVVALYQGLVVIPGFTQPRAVVAVQLIGASRAEGQQVSAPAGTKFIDLSADIPPEFHFSSYLCRVFRDGKEAFSVPVAPPKEGTPVTLSVSVDKLKPGKYELKIYGDRGDGNPISTYPFDFQTK